MHTAPARTRHRHESNRSHSPQRKLLWRRGTAARARGTRCRAKRSQTWKTWEHAPHFAVRPIPNDDLTGWTSKLLHHHHVSPASMKTVSAASPQPPCQGLSQQPPAWNRGKRPAETAAARFPAMPGYPPRSWAQRSHPRWAWATQGRAGRQARPRYRPDQRGNRICQSSFRRRHHFHGLQEGVNALRTILGAQRGPGSPLRQMQANTRHQTAASRSWQCGERHHAISNGTQGGRQGVSLHRQPCTTAASEYKSLQGPGAVVIGFGILLDGRVIDLEHRSVLAPWSLMAWRAAPGPATRGP